MGAPSHTLELPAFLLYILAESLYIHAMSGFSAYTHILVITENKLSLPKAAHATPCACNVQVYYVNVNDYITFVKKA